MLIAYVSLQELTSLNYIGSIKMNWYKFGRGAGIALMAAAFCWLVYVMVVGRVDLLMCVR